MASGLSDGCWKKTQIQLIWPISAVLRCRSLWYKGFFAILHEVLVRFRPDLTRYQPNPVRSALPAILPSQIAIRWDQSCPNLRSFRVNGGFCSSPPEMVGLSPGWVLTQLVDISNCLRCLIAILFILNAGVSFVYILCTWVTPLSHLINEIFTRSWNYLGLVTCLLERLNEDHYNIFMCYSTFNWFWVRLIQILCNLLVMWFCCCVFGIVYFPIYLYRCWFLKPYFFLGTTCLLRQISKWI